MHELPQALPFRQILQHDLCSELSQRGSTVRAESGSVEVDVGHNAFELDAGDASLEARAERGGVNDSAAESALDFGSGAWSQLTTLKATKASDNQRPIFSPPSGSLIPSRENGRAR